jgi:hypothetical protein
LQLFQNISYLDMGEGETVGAWAGFCGGCRTVDRGSQVESMVSRRETSDYNCIYILHCCFLSLCLCLSICHALTLVIFVFFIILVRSEFDEGDMCFCPVWGFCMFMGIPSLGVFMSMVV